MEKLTLKSLFESGKTDLTEQLKQLSLPRDAQKVQTIVTEHLNKLFDSEGEYRQHLTQSEDYILQAAMSLLNAQQAMAGEFAAKSYAPSPTPKTEPKNDMEKAAGLRKEQYPIAIGGSAIGGATGALLFGTWGAVFGAIAGTAVVLYSVASKTSKKSANNCAIHTLSKNTPIDIDVFLSIVGNICVQLDNIIGTFRVQVKRIVNMYEQREKPTLMNQYGGLMEHIVNVHNICSKTENVPMEIKLAIEMMANSLQNYDLHIENGQIKNI